MEGNDCALAVLPYDVMGIIRSYCVDSVVSAALTCKTWYEYLSKMEWRSLMPKHTMLLNRGHSQDYNELSMYRCLRLLEYSEVPLIHADLIITRGRISLLSAVGPDQFERILEILCPDTLSILISYIVLPYFDVRDYYYSSEAITLLTDTKIYYVDVVHGTDVSVDISECDSGREAKETRFLGFQEGRVVLMRYLHIDDSVYRFDNIDREWKLVSGKMQAKIKLKRRHFAWSDPLDSGRTGRFDKVKRHYLSPSNSFACYLYADGLKLNVNPLDLRRLNNIEIVNDLETEYNKLLSKAGPPCPNHLVKEVSGAALLGSAEHNDCGWEAQADNLEYGEIDLHEYYNKKYIGRARDYHLDTHLDGITGQDVPDFDSVMHPREIVANLKHAFDAFDVADKAYASDLAIDLKQRHIATVNKHSDSSSDSESESELDPEQTPGDDFDMKQFHMDIIDDQDDQNDQDD